MTSDLHSFEKYPKLIVVFLVVAILAISPSLAGAGDNTKVESYFDFYKLSADDLTVNAGRFSVTFQEGAASFHYSIGLGANEKGEVYLHTPAAAWAGAFILSQTGDDEDLDWLKFVGFLLILAPEGISYNYNVGKNTIIAPFASLNSLDVLYRDDETDYMLNMEAGCRIRYYFTQSVAAQISVSGVLLAQVGPGYKASVGLTWR